MFLYVLTILSNHNWVEWRVRPSVYASYKFFQLIIFIYQESLIACTVLVDCYWPLMRGRCVYTCRGCVLSDWNPVRTGTHVFAVFAPRPRDRRYFHIQRFLEANAHLQIESKEAVGGKNRTYVRSCRFRYHCYFAYRCRGVRHRCLHCTYIGLMIQFARGMHTSQIPEFNLMPFLKFS